MMQLLRKLFKGVKDDETMMLMEESKRKLLEADLSLREIHERQKQLEMRQKILGIQADRRRL